jgi:ubiquinone/menaquinone biosynthesis C-methylase UbiE
LNIFFEIHKDIPREGPGSDYYTRAMFNSIGHKSGNRIKVLDIGCGPGQQTLALARCGSVTITAIDTHQPFLDELNRRAVGAGLADSITTRNMSMFELDLPDESFDVIWAEGSIYIISPDKGLTNFARFLKPGGHIGFTHVAWIREDPPGEIISFWEEEQCEVLTVKENESKIAGAGYNLLRTEILPPSAWTDQYYYPVEERLDRLAAAYRDDEEAMNEIEVTRHEIEMFNRYHEWYSYVFYLAEKPK